MSDHSPTLPTQPDDEPLLRTRLRSSFLLALLTLSAVALFACSGRNGDTGPSVSRHALTLAPAPGILAPAPGTSATSLTGIDQSAVALTRPDLVSKEAVAATDN